MKKSAFLIFFLIPFFGISQQASVLSSGDWYKIAVEETGIYKITYDDLLSYGLDVDNLNPKNLALYGNPAGMLPEPLDAPSYTDLQTMAIQVVGEDDGVFGPDDYILFYGQGPVVWHYDPGTGHFHHQVNYYSRQTFYFLTVGSQPGKRIQQQQSTDLPETGAIKHYDLFLYHEKELVNPGSTGRKWLGEDFKDENPEVFNYNLSNYQIIPGDSYLKVELAANCTDFSNVDIKLNDILLSTVRMPVSGSYPYQFFRNKTDDTLGSFGHDEFDLSFAYDFPNDSAEAWIDYFEMNLKQGKVMAGDQMPFRSVENTGPGEVSTFSLQLEQPEQLKVWNVTDPMNVKQEELNVNAQSVSWKLHTDSLLEFQAFTGNQFYQPVFAGQVENQNLHAMAVPDLIIITHPDFLEQADQLASFHQTEDDLDAAVVTVGQIYNEFSSGSQDVTAIRNFIKYLKNRSDGNKPGYLLLFGDASYDYLDRVENNTNFVPVYETEESSNAVWSFAGDAYYGLNDMSRNDNTKVAVGRLPVTTGQEADELIQKIEDYSSVSALGNWKNEMLFIADDGDNNLHLNQEEYLVDLADTNSPVYNFTKGYFDFYALVQTEEGPRYPEVNALITDKMNDGVFYVNYTGHGSHVQLSNERVLSADDLPGWTNRYNFPLWVTATSDVAHFDNPAYTSLGEKMALLNEAGAIALIGPTRGTFASSNMVYNTAVLTMLTEESRQQELRLGDLVKEQPSGGDNDAKYVLLGDPALKMAFPEFGVNTTEVNGVPVNDYTDTIPPGSFLALRGEIVSKEDSLLQAGFNGTVYLKIYAPPFIRTTLGNQGDPIKNIVVQDSVLAEKSAPVENGKFYFSLYLPSFTPETFGNLKLSWYAQNGVTDANGFYNGLLYGGEPNAIHEDFLSETKIYPVPFSNDLTVELPSSGLNDATIRIYNTLGNTVYKIRTNSASGRMKLNLQSLPQGMYILNLTSKKSSKNFKLIKQ